VAYTVRKLRQLEKAGELKEHRKRELPNGMVIIHKNNSETDFLYNEIFERNTYLRNGIRLRDGDCIFDVGANIGLFSLFMGTRFRGLDIYAFEPIPPLFETLKLNMELYGIDARLFELGLSKETGEDIFHYYRHDTIISGRQANVDLEKAAVRRYV